jgi:hypothetical protein
VSFVYFNRSDGLIRSCLGSDICRDRVRYSLAYWSAAMRWDSALRAQPKKELTVERIAVSRAIAPTPTDAIFGSVKRLLLPMDVAPFSTPKIMTGRSVMFFSRL